MYLRPSNEWNEFLLAEAIENVGLPQPVVDWVRDIAARSYEAETESTPNEKVLTYVGLLLKKHPTTLINTLMLEALAEHIKKYILDDEDLPALSFEEKAEKITQVIQPILAFKASMRTRPHTIQDVKRMVKGLSRGLKKIGVSQEFIDQTSKEAYQTMINLGAAGEYPSGLEPRLRQPLDMLFREIAKDPPIYEEEFKSLVTLTAAVEMATHIRTSPKKDPQKVIHTFDNGYFWYDVQSYHCDLEAKEMGHCGRGEQGALVSLRAGGGRAMKPFITLEFDGTTLYQIKGKGNTAPKKDLWPYVDWFIENMGVEKILETGQHASDHEGFDEMLEYFDEKHPDIKLKNSWVKEATELLEQYEGSIEEDSQTSFSFLWPGGTDDVQEVGVVLRHQAYWPVKDIIVDEDTHRLRWDIKQDAQSIADDTLYPNPRIPQLPGIFARGIQDSQTAMIRVELMWEDSFEPRDDGDERSIKEELGDLEKYLAEIEEIAGHLVSTQAAPEDAEFDYNGFFEGVIGRLEAYGVYRDIAGEIDAERERSDSEQMELPLQESHILQRWQQIIK